MLSTSLVHWTFNYLILFEFEESENLTFSPCNLQIFTLTLRIITNYSIFVNTFAIIDNFFIFFFYKHQLNSGFSIFHILFFDIFCLIYIKKQTIMMIDNIERKYLYAQIYDCIAYFDYVLTILLVSCSS